MGLQGLSGKSTVDLAYLCLRRCVTIDWWARTLKHSPGKDRLHIYRRACFGGVHRGPQIRTAQQDSIREKWLGDSHHGPKAEFVSGPVLGSQKGAGKRTTVGVVVGLPVPQERVADALVDCMDRGSIGHHAIYSEEGAAPVRMTGNGHERTFILVAGSTDELPNLWTRTQSKE